MNQGRDIAYAAPLAGAHPLPGGGDRPLPVSMPFPLADQEEPEIVRMYAAYYRALLNLGTLDDRQRTDVSKLLSKCEVRLRRERDAHVGLERAGQTRPAAAVRTAPSPEGSRPLPCRRLHEQQSCLTSVRLYAAVARRALESGHADMVLG